MFAQSDCATNKAGSSVLLGTTIHMRIYNFIISGYTVPSQYFPYSLASDYIKFLLIYLHIFFSLRFVSQQIKFLNSQSNQLSIRLRRRKIRKKKRRQGTVRKQVFIAYKLFSHLEDSKCRNKNGFVQCVCTAWTPRENPHSIF